MITIEKGVPVPSHSKNTTNPRRGHNDPDDISIALRSMVVGDSILVPFKQATYTAMRTRATKLGRSGEKKFATRREGNATRVWRVSLESTDDLA